jgi:hypothetical protein
MLVKKLASLLLFNLTYYIGGQIPDAQELPAYCSAVHVPTAGLFSYQYFGTDLMNRLHTIDSSLSAGRTSI